MPQAFSTFFLFFSFELSSSSSYAYTLIPGHEYRIRSGDHTYVKSRTLQQYASTLILLYVSMQALNFNF